MPLRASERRRLPWYFASQMLQHLQRLDDPTVTFDIVQAGVLKGGRLDLEGALLLLPALNTLLSSTFEDHTLAAINAIAELARGFGQLIRSTRAMSKNMLGVDLSAEARLQRCQACYEQLSSMIPRLKSLAGSGGKLQTAALGMLATLRSEVELPA